MDDKTITSTAVDVSTPATIPKDHVGATTITVDLQVGLRISAARIAAGLTPQALAKSCAIPTRILTAYEDGTARPPPLQLIRLSKALDVSIKGLLVG